MVAEAVGVFGHDVAQKLVRISEILDDFSFYIAVSQFRKQASETIHHFCDIVQVSLSHAETMLGVVAFQSYAIGVAKRTFGNGAIHFDGMNQIGSFVGSVEEVAELVIKCLVGKELLVVSEVVKVVVGSDEAHIRLQVAIEVVLAVFRRVDVETVGHKNPGIHHEVAVFHRLDGLLRVEPHLEFQGELVVDFCG